ncbi:MAG: BatA domain-containing protein [Bacteroidota bacterium]
MTFVNPSYLWALASLAIPIAIHLLSRKEGKVIRVGSLRHVEESNTSQFKSIRLNEILLLLLRCLMISLVVLFMSGAQCSGTSGKILSGLWPNVESMSTVLWRRVTSTMNARRQLLGKRGRS